MSKFDIAYLRAKEITDGAFLSIRYGVDIDVYDYALKRRGNF